MFACMYVYICMYVCMHVCMYVFMYVCMHACMYVCMYACVHVCLCIYVCMYVCMCIYNVFVRMCIFVRVYMYVCMYACMHVCMYACMYVCIYVCVYICMCIYVCVRVSLLSHAKPQIRLVWSARLFTNWLVWQVMSLCHGASRCFTVHGIARDWFMAWHYSSISIAQKPEMDWVCYGLSMPYMRKVFGFLWLSWVPNLTPVTRFKIIELLTWAGYRPALRNLCESMSTKNRWQMAESFCIWN